jgi:hypothetical protein
MNKRSFATTAILLAILVTPVISKARNGCDALAYFIPLDIETYTPITTETIESRSFERWCLSSSSEVDHLLSILTGEGHVNFSASRVRMKVVSPNATRFVDANGTVSSDGRTGARIDAKALQKFRDSLESDAIISFGVNQATTTR